MDAKTKFTKEPVKLCLRSRKNGTQVIYLEIYTEGKRTYERIPDLVMLPEDDDKSIAKNYSTLRKAQKILMQRLREFKKTMKSSRYELDVLPEEKPITLVEWMDRFHDIQKSRGVRDLSRITTTKKILLSDAKDGEFRDIALKDVDKKVCLDFIDHLRCEYKGRNGRKLSSKTNADYLATLNTALNTAVREGLITRNPVSLLAPNEKFIRKETIREYLTIDEVKSLIATPCDCPIVKQAFLFACNCGLRISDVRALRWRDINMEDKTWNIGVRQIKTDRVVYMPLSLQARQWMPKPVSSDLDSIIFPKLTHSMIDENLKPWIKAAGITNKEVTFHTSRHTYATMLLTLGVDLYTVSKLLGHTSIRHTQRYAKIIDKKIDETISLIDANID